MNVLTEWNAFIEDESYEPSSLESLFSEGVLKSELDAMLAGTKNSEAVIERILEALKYRDRAPAPFNEEELSSAVRSKMEEDKYICNLLGAGELVPSAIGGFLEYRDFSTEQMRAKDPDGLIRDMISDWFLDLVDWSQKVQVGLRYACYGIANNYEVVRYIMSPLLNVPKDFSSSFELWKLGYGVVYRQQEMVVGPIRQ